MVMSPVVLLTIALAGTVRLPVVSNFQDFELPALMVTLPLAVTMLTLLVPLTTAPEVSAYVALATVPVTLAPATLLLTPLVNA